MSRASMRHSRRAGCSWRRASVIIMPSHGSTPEWFATTRAAPSAGTLSTPAGSTRHQTVYRNSSSGRIVSVNLASRPKSSTSSECHEK